MSTEPDSGGGKHYQVGDVDGGSRVIVGDGNSWVEQVGTLPEGAQLARELASLIQSLKSDSALDPEDRDLAVEKTEAVATALTKAGQSPDLLRKTLRDARQFLAGQAGWAWDRLRNALTSDAGKAVLATITDSTVKAAIGALLGVPTG